MFCKHCGTELPDTAKFCTNCGKAVSQEQPAPNPQRVAPKRTPFYKAPFFWILLGLIVISYIFMQVTESKTAAEKKAQSEVINPIDADCYDCHVTYLGYKIEGDSKPRIMVYYKFSNNEDSKYEYDYDFCTTSKAYQDGKMLEYYFGDSQEEKDCDTKIKPGVSITVCTGYYLRNRYSPVEVLLQEYVPLFLTDLGTMTIPIS